MVLKVKRADLYRGNGEMIYCDCDEKEMISLTKQDSRVAYAVLKEGILTDAIGHEYFIPHKTVDIFTREELENK